MAWTIERIKELQELKALGWSAGMVAERLETTRNAVIGKIHRMKLEVRRVPIVSRPAFRPNNCGRKYNRKPPTPVVQLVLDLPTTGIPFMHLASFHCRWVLDGRGEDGLATFCGNQKHNGQSFCLFHYRRTIYRPPVREAA